MNRQELIYALRTEAWEIQELMKKLQKRRDKLNDLADEIEGPDRQAEEAKQAAPNKFRKIVDAIYGEEPKKKGRG